MNYPQNAFDQTPHIQRPVQLPSITTEALPPPSSSDSNMEEDQLSNEEDQLSDIIRSIFTSPRPNK